MRKSLSLLVVLSLMLPVPVISVAATKPIPGAKCAKLNSSKTYGGNKFTCVKIKGKLVWDKGSSLSKNPLGELVPQIPTVPLTAINSLEATLQTEGVFFSFKKSDENLVDTTYEVGYQILKSEGLDPSSGSNYLDEKKFKSVVTTQFLISFIEIRNLFEKEQLETAKLAIMFKVRAVSRESTSVWGNGIYILPQQYLAKVSEQEIPTPSPSAKPSPNPFGSAADKAAADKAAADKAAADKVKYCDLKIGCKVGEVGPAGGFIFYVASTPQSWGTYLEVSDTNIQSQWCNSTQTYLSKNVVDEKLKQTIGTEIGRGQGNTQLMLAGCESGAAITATNYRKGGYSDWFLPSLMELNEVCKFARVQQTGTNTICSPSGPLLNLFLTSFTKSPVIGQYWSSSEYSGPGADGWTAWAVSFYANQWQSSENKKGLRPVVAIRAFGNKSG